MRLGSVNRRSIGLLAWPRDLSQVLFQDTSVASEEAFGTTGQLNLFLVQAASIASEEAFGAGNSLVRILGEQTSIPSAEAFGAGGALVITTLHLIGSGILSEEAMGGGILSVGLVQDASIPTEETFGSGSTLLLVNGLYQDASIPSAEAFGTGGILQAGTLYLTGSGIQSEESVGGGSLSFLVSLVESTSIPSEERFGTGGVIAIQRDACAGPLLTLPAAVANMSSAELAAQSGLPQYLFDAFLDSIPSANLKRHATAVANALGIDPGKLKARLALEERRYVGRTAAPRASEYSSLKNR